MVSLAANREGRWVLVRFDVHAPARDEAESLLSVSRGVIESHHGAWRMTAAPDRTVIETRLPAAALPTAAPQARRQGKQLTLLALAA